MDFKNLNLKKKQKKDSSADLFVAFFVGAAAGAIAAILMAPDSGKNTWNKVKEAARDLTDEIKNLTENLKMNEDLMDEADEEMTRIEGQLSGVAKDLKEDDDNK